MLVRWRWLKGGFLGLAPPGSVKQKEGQDAFAWGGFRMRPSPVYNTTPNASVIRASLANRFTQTELTMRVDRFRFWVFGGLFSLIDYWKAKRLPLVCPSCLEPPTSATLVRGQRLMGEKQLRCEACGAANDIAGWRLAAEYQKRGDPFPFLAGN